MRNASAEVMVSPDEFVLCIVQGSEMGSKAGWITKLSR